MTFSTQRSHSSQTLHVMKKKSRRAAPGEAFDDYILRRKKENEQKHKTISIWKSPLLVISYFAMYTYYELQSLCLFFYRRCQLSLVSLSLLGLLVVFYGLEGPHQGFVQQMERQATWYGYWLLLGIASAIGLGTGLHTFLLFLGPYIAEVTMAAYMCQSTDLLTRDRQSYRLQCDMSYSSFDNVLETKRALASLSLWVIYRQIRWECFAWGAGTALGELPPYFMARAVALSGNTHNELEAYEEALTKKTDLTLKETVSLFLYKSIQRLGFFGILLFASIPNPLFDLAGITCGHFLVPFSTFFGATFIGKACVKASLQSMIVILAFSKDTLSGFLGLLERTVPPVHTIVKEMIYQQAHQFDKGHLPKETSAEQSTIFSYVWNIFISLMILYFVISSVESLGLAQMRRKHDEEIKQLEHRHKQEEKD
ncbi:hypothetical protein BDF14DRAFT_1824057 [Spinellus fusiger]|nr:hypothetical protein BDF14DRAFT_1824057 [Spinellus fusiger]